MAIERDIVERERPEVRKVADEQARPPLAAEHVLALQRTAGNQAVIQRLVTVGAGTQKHNLVQVLGKHGVKREAERRAWFTQRVSPRLVGRFGFARFNGYLTGYRSEYQIEVETGEQLDKLSFDQITDAIVRALNLRIMAERVEHGHSALGEVKLLKRQGFPSAVKTAFDKRPIQAATGLGAKQVHLRHFIMGSWFRALPDAFARANLDDRERGSLTPRLGKLIGFFGVHGGKPNAPVANDLTVDAETLASILHDLVPNLNAGEGPENTMIGLLSHGLSDLAFMIADQDVSIEQRDVGALIEAAIETVTLIEREARAEWVAFANPVATFEVLVRSRVGMQDPVPSDAMSEALHQLAFSLGIDFMKRKGGLATDWQDADIGQLQSMLLPVGDRLYGLVLSAQGDVGATDLEKLVNELEAFAVGLGKLVEART